MGLALEAVSAAKGKGFDEAVVNFSSGISSYLKITNSKIDSVAEQYDESGGLFAAKDKKVVFTNIEKRSGESAGEALGRAKDALRYAIPKADYYGIAQGPFRYAKHMGYDAKLYDYGVDTLADMAEACINAAMENGAEKVAGTVFAFRAASEMATTKGVASEWKSTRIKVSLRMFRKATSFQDVTASSFLKDIKPEAFVGNEAELMRRVDKTGSIGAGTYDILYLPSPGGSLIAELDAMAAMGNVETGSVFTGRLGKRVAGRDVSLFDDGNAAGSVDAMPFDQEGYPTQKTSVIKEGVLTNYLHNYSTARKYKTRSTGNAGLVTPGPNTPVFTHRKQVKDINELIGRMEKGIVITNTWYTRFANYVTGDFSTVPRDMALYVERGEPKFVIRKMSVSSMVGIRITDSVPRMLNNIECVARDTRQATSWDAGSYYFMPSMLVNGVRVSVA